MVDAAVGDAAGVDAADVDAPVAGIGYHVALLMSKNTAPKAAAVRVRRIPVTGIARGHSFPALSKDTAQSQEDEHCQRREDDGVNIHVVFAFWFKPRGRRRDLIKVIRQ